MGVQDVLTRKTGVIVGDDVLALFKYAREKGFAIPAVVRSSFPPRSGDSHAPFGCFRLTVQKG